jgi:DNA-binding beta-propeller fold protein YncE
VVSPDGSSVYVAGAATNSVFQYDVRPSGALSPKSPATVAAGANPFGVAVSPDGGSVYVTNPNSDDVSQYSVGAGGSLSPKSPATVAAGDLPVGVAVSPQPSQPRRPGKGCGDKNHVHEREADCKKPPPQ